MLYVKIAVVLIMFSAMAAALVYLARRIKAKPIIPGNAPWIFYLIEKMFGENDSSAKEVKENELP